ncbi:murein biosynthesis integral membrane protein MurJ [Actinomyces wuliandei]|uniref:murein biosynthesis integral membrane protein MurJ n=1 Tax=Actinomyces wuliandei TaxID=2057743 RepID=UPI000FD7753E|nr:murein biosynthesis integral membrane protein MurJ [Actinomyces wuliandei]
MTPPRHARPRRSFLSPSPHRSQASLARSSAIMASGTLVSRVLGLVRNALIVIALGATGSGAADAFNTANNLPTNLYNMMIGGVLNAILVPQIVRALRKRNGEELVNRLLTTAATLMLAVTVLITAAAPLVFYVNASSLASGRWQPVSYAFAFWFMPQIFFYGLYALWGQVLNARSSFGPYMWSPVLNNIISIVSIIAYIRVYGAYTDGQGPEVWDAGRITLIGATTTLGIAAQALILYIPLVRSGFQPRIVFGIRGLGLGQSSRVALWALLGVAIISLSTWATTNLGSAAVTASELPEYADVVVPSTTMWSNAYLVYILPQSLVVTSIITALFTRMSEKASSGDREGVRDDLSLGLRSAGVFTVLATAGICVLAVPALQVFTPSISLRVAQATAPVLVLLALGIVPQGIWFTTQRVMLAYEDTKRLLLADAVVGLLPVVLCALAYLLAPANHWMAWAAFANTLSQVAACVVVVPLMRRHLPSLDGRRVATTHLRLCLAAAPAVVIGLVLVALMGEVDGASSLNRLLAASTQVVIVASVMSFIYLVMGRIVNVEEIIVAFRPLSRILVKVGRRLPGPAGRPVLRLAEWMTPTSAPTRGTSGSRTAPPAPPPPQAAPPPPPPPAAAPTATPQPAPAPPPPSAPTTAPHGAPAHGQPQGTYPPSFLPHAPSSAGRSGRAPVRRPVVPAVPPTVPPSVPPAPRTSPATATTPPTEHAMPLASPPPPAHPAGAAATPRGTAPAPPPDSPSLPANLSVSMEPSAAVPPSGHTTEQAQSPRTATMGPSVSDGQSPRGRRRMSEATPIGSGRYGLLGTLSTTLPRIVRHRGVDTILDREVTILVLTDASVHRDSIMDAASRAVLVDDERLQRVYDVERSEPSIIITEPLAGRTLSSLVARGITSAQVRAIIGETAQALDAGARKGLHHLNLSPESIRVLPGGEVKISGLGIEAAALDLESKVAKNDPLAADRADARALVEILYYGLTGRWPGKRPGIPSAPRLGGAPVVPSTLVAGIDPVLDDLCVRTWNGQPPISAAEVARALGSWEPVSGYVVDPARDYPAAVRTTAQHSGPDSTSHTAGTGVATAARGVLDRLRRSSSASGGASAATSASATQAPQAAVTDSFAQHGSAHDATGDGTVVTDDLRAEEEMTPRAGLGYVQVTGPVNPMPSMLTNASETAPGAAPVPSEPFTGSFEVNFDDFEDEEDEVDEEVVQSVSRTTTSVILTLIVLALVGVVIAVLILQQLVGIRFTDPDEPAADTVPSTTSAQSAQDGSGEADNQAGGEEGSEDSAPITVSGAQSLDPFGDGNEHPELADRLVDGDTSQEWFSRYYNDPGMDGKGGVGVAVTLEEAAEVSGIDIHGTGEGGSVQIRATSPEDPAGGELLAEGPFTSQATSFDFDSTETASVVVWITELPRAADGSNKATITEITLR